MAATATPLRKGAELGNGTVWLFPSASMAGVIRIVAWVQEERRGLVEGHWCCSCQAPSRCWHIHEAAKMQGDVA